MEIYRVGGAVRDELLGLEVDEIDWVVVGATPEALLARGYRPVGQDFPVFLHPQSGEEYALARTERKTAAGYHGFAFSADPGVSLEDDLARRDLTINAMARAADGALIDPYGGQNDLQARRLRHVTAAFAEDPVRILRLARFAARFAPLGFRVADETLALCRRMVAAGEVDALVPERVWREFARALMEPEPRRFIELLSACGALRRLLPELDAATAAAPTAPNGDAPEAEGAATPAAPAPDSTTAAAPDREALCVLDAAVALEAPLESRFAAWLAAAVPAVDGVAAACERLRVPRNCRDLAVAVVEHAPSVRAVLTASPAAVVELLTAIDAYRRPHRLDPFLLACAAIDRAGSEAARGEATPWPQGRALRAAFAASQALSAQPFVAAGLRGPQIGAALRAARVEAVAAVWSGRRG